MMSSEGRDFSSEGGWEPKRARALRALRADMEKARVLLEGHSEEAVEGAGDAFRAADEALVLWGSIDALVGLAEKKRSEAALLRAGIEDAIRTLTHLMKQSGKPDQSEIVSRVVQIVVPRLHQVLAGENPYEP